MPDVRSNQGGHVGGRPNNPRTEIVALGSGRGRGREKMAPLKTTEFLPHLLGHFPAGWYQRHGVPGGKQQKPNVAKLGRQGLGPGGEDVPGGAVPQSHGLTGPWRETPPPSWSGFCGLSHHRWLPTPRYRGSEDNTSRLPGIV